jgi:4-hydroxy-3-polyprenylbenzoate decarboxylase
MCRIPKEAWWEALNNMDPARDVLLNRGPADALDHASDLPWLHSKMGIDGTRKTKARGGLHAPVARAHRNDP